MTCLRPIDIPRDEHSGKLLSNILIHHGSIQEAIVDCAVIQAIKSIQLRSDQGKVSKPQADRPIATCQMCVAVLEMESIVIVFNIQ